jgi:hypothetical protein
MNTAAKPRMRISELSVVVDAGHLLTWLAHVGRMEGLTRVESAFALYLAGQLAATGLSSMTMSLEAIAHAMHSAPLPVRRAIDGLVGHGVLGFTPGYGTALSYDRLPAAVARAKRSWTLTLKLATRSHLSALSRWPPMQKPLNGPCRSEVASTEVDLQLEVRPPLEGRQASRANLSRVLPGDPARSGSPPSSPPDRSLPSTWPRADPSTSSPCRTAPWAWPTIR